MKKNATYQANVNPHSIWENYVLESGSEANLYLTNEDDQRIETISIADADLETLTFQVNTFGGDNNDYGVQFAGFMAARAPYNFSNGQMHTTSDGKMKMTFDISDASPLVIASGQSSETNQSPVVWKYKGEHKKKIVVKLSDERQSNEEEQFFLVLLINKGEKHITVILDPIITTNTQTPPPGEGGNA
ncbi:MAG TPA: hypothetical protein DCR93_37180 [Cytophagales bacterium]|nr:hypothetical protein [Cytophagales bacterium]